jgi:hypothetical protein
MKEMVVSCEKHVSDPCDRRRYDDVVVAVVWHNARQDDRQRDYERAGLNALDEVSDPLIVQSMNATDSLISEDA